MDYFDIAQTDLISTIGNATILQSVELLGTASPYAAFVRRGPNGDPTQFVNGAPITAAGQIGNTSIDNIYVTDTLTNIAAVDLSGIDLKVAYTWNSDALGKFDFSLAGAWYNSYTVQTLPDVDPYETVGLTSSFNGTTPEWQTYTSAAWSRGKWNATLGWTYIPSTTDESGIPAGPGVDSASDDYVEDYHAFDVLRELQLRLGLPLPQRPDRPRWRAERPQRGPADEQGHRHQQQRRHRHLRCDRPPDLRRGQV